MIYETNYKKFISIFPIEVLENMDLGDTLTLKSGAFMDLKLSRLTVDLFLMEHNFEQNNDLVPDPEMELKIYGKEKMIEALTWRTQMFYSQSYNEYGHALPRRKKENNSFLRTWLMNLKRQGFKAEPKPLEPNDFPKFFDESNSIGEPSIF